jgi:hypothetical protein
MDDTRREQWRPENDLVWLWVRWAVVVVLVGAAVYFGFVSWRWPVMVDSAVMHYVNFLMQHGMKPYRDITDNNMPGAYLAEGWAMRVFGAGDRGWRVYDYCLLMTLTAGLAYLARRRDWVAGFFAGGLFLVLYAADGPRFAVEREEVITVLLVLSYVALFEAVSRRRAWLGLVFGLTGGMAGAIKPTFLPLTLGLLVFAAVVLWRRRVSPWSTVGWAAGGIAMVGAVNVWFLLHYGVMNDFVFILRKVIPAYVGGFKTPLAVMVQQTLPVSLLVLLVLGALAGVANWRAEIRWNWEQMALAGGAVFSLASFYLQGKAFQHHRYTYEVLLLLLLGMEFTTCLRRRGWSQGLAVLAFGITCLWVVPHQLRTLSRLALGSEFMTSLEGDLQQMGGPAALQDKVQCFDMVYGCLGALEHMQIVENTGFTGDMLFFAGQDGVAAAYYKAMFWRLARRDPAAVLVVSNEWFQRENSFRKLEAWPQFDQYLAQNYTLVEERRFEGEGLKRLPPRPKGDRAEAYRIYVRKGSALAERAADGSGRGSQRF